MVEVNKEKSKGNDVTSTSLNHDSRTKGSYDPHACMHSFQVDSMRTRRPYAPHHTRLTIAPVLKLKTIATSRIWNPQSPYHYNTFLASQSSPSATRLRPGRFGRRSQRLDHRCFEGWKVENLKVEMWRDVVWRRVEEVA